MPPTIIGMAGIVVTVALHAMTTSMMIYVYSQSSFEVHIRIPMWRKALLLGLAATVLAVKHYIDIVLWAMAYWLMASKTQFDDFETAVYFSSVTYTTLGYGDIVPMGSWRVLCGIQAMNGILLFGWSTALLIMLVQQIWFRDVAVQDQVEVGNQKPAGG